MNFRGKNSCDSPEDRSPVNCDPCSLIASLSVRTLISFSLGLALELKSEGLVRRESSHELKGSMNIHDTLREYLKPGAHVAVL